MDEVPDARGTFKMDMVIVLIISSLIGICICFAGGGEEEGLCCCCGCCMILSVILFFASLGWLSSWGWVYRPWDGYEVYQFTVDAGTEEAGTNETRRRFLADDNDTTCPFANEPVMPVRLLGLEEEADSHQSEPCTRPENALCGDIQIQVRKLSGDKDKLTIGYVTVGIEGELEFGRCATRSVSPSLSYEHESYSSLAPACGCRPPTAVIVRTMLQRY